MNPKTAEGYARALRRHIFPIIGTRLRVSAITPAVIGDLATRLAIDPLGRTLNGEPTRLGVSSRRNAMLAVRHVLDSAVTDGLLSANHAKDKPLAKRPRRKALDLRVEPEQINMLARILDTIKDSEDHQLYTLARFVLFTGCRRADAVNLKWTDVDIDAGVVDLASKTAAGERAVVVHPALLADLLAHRRAQIADRLAAPRWTDTGYVFTTRIGTRLDPRKTSKRFRALCEAAGIDGSTHRLRHHVASAMLANGVSPAEVAQILGHKDANVTLGFYAHPTAAGTRRAILALGDSYAAGE